MSGNAKPMNGEGGPVVYLTREGYNKLRERLEYLTTVKRREIAEQIREAKAMGDISENAGYDEAKNAQGFLEGEIAEIEWKLKHAVIIEEEPSDGVIKLGSKVTVRVEGEDEEETYVIVGSAEADPFSGRISNESPVGSALMGRSVGDTVEVETPGGRLKMEIITVE